MDIKFKPFAVANCGGPNTVIISLVDRESEVSAEIELDDAKEFALKMLRLVYQQELLNDQEELKANGY